MKKHHRLLAALLITALLFGCTPLWAFSEPIKAGDSPSNAISEATDETEEGFITTLAEGPDPYDEFTGNVGSADKKTYNVFVGVGRGMTIGKFNDVSFDPDKLNIDELDKELATLEKTTYGTGINGLRVRGLKEGVTSFKIGEDTYKLYVVPGISSFAQNSKTVEIKIADMTDCTAYFSINGGDLQKIEEGYLINQTFVGGFQISFFAAPDEGYALTQMKITGTGGQYYSLGDGTRTDGSDSEAWPLNDPDALDPVSTNNDNIWKKNHGFKTPFSHFMTVKRLRELFTQALQRHCDGTAQFGNYWGHHDREAEITFAAEKLPTMVKSISRYRLNQNATDSWQNYDPQNPPELRLGSMLEYTFTISRSGTQSIEYTDVLLVDEKIGYKLLLTYQDGHLLGYIGGSKKDKPDWEFDSSETELKITVQYTLNEQDLSKYFGGSFENSATLSYNYRSIYSAGVYSVAQSSQADCKIFGLVTYQWASNIPEEIQREFVCPDSHQFVANASAEVQGEDLVGKYKILCSDNVWKKWTFQGWKLQEDAGTDLYKPGDAVTATDYSTSTATFVGQWKSEELQPHSVTYRWEGLPEGHNQALPAPQSCYEAQKFSVDSTYQQETLVTIGNVNYVFSGWKNEEGQVVSGEQLMGAEDIVLTGRWVEESTLVTLTITTENCDTIDKDQVFLFRVTGEGLDVTVSVQGNGSTSIFGLRSGKTYTVTELTDWSWRYGSIPATQTITPDENGAQVTFGHSRTAKQWLDGNCIWDIFKKEEEEGV